MLPLHEIDLSYLLTIIEKSSTYVRERGCELNKI